MAAEWRSFSKTSKSDPNEVQIGATWGPCQFGWDRDWVGWDRDGLGMGSTELKIPQNSDLVEPPAGLHL